MSDTVDRNQKWYPEVWVLLKTYPNKNYLVNSIVGQALGADMMAIEARHRKQKGEKHDS